MNDPFDPFNQLLTETPAHLLAAGQEWVKQQFYEELLMYHDMHLKFADQVEADGILFDEQTSVQDDVVETYKVPKYAAVDTIGVIWKPTGKMISTDEGEVPEMAPLEGWHANVRHTAEAPELDLYRVTPQNPVRGWA
jgi:hypothetical protein